MREFLTIATRMWTWLIVAGALVAWLYQTQPQQIPVIFYKVTLVTLASWIGYWIDRNLFRDKLTPESESWRQIRRAIIVGATILGMTLGL